MDVKNKKTVLDDEASIYHHSEEVSEKEKWSSLTGAKKWEYFKSYYLMKIVAILLLAGVLGSLLYTMLTPKPKLVFSVAVINAAMVQQQCEKVQEEFEALIELDKETQQTSFDSGYYFYSGEYESLQKFATYNAVGQLDVTIMPLSIFEQYAPAGYFAPLAEKLPTDLYLELSSYLMEAMRRDESGNLMENSETVFGVRIDGTWVYNGYTTGEPVVLAINAASGNQDNVLEFLRYLFK